MASKGDKYLDMELVSRFAELKHKLNGAKAEIETIKEELAGLEEAVRAQFLDNGVQNVPVRLADGGQMTVYLRSLLFVKPKEDRFDVMVALKECGLGDLISSNYNTNSLSAWVRECLANEHPIPAALDEVIIVDEKVEVLAQLSGKRESKSAAAKRTLEKQRQQKKD